MAILDQYWAQILNLKQCCDTAGHQHELVGLSTAQVHFLSSIPEDCAGQYQVLISCKRLKLDSWQQVVIFSDKLYLYFNPKIDPDSKAALQMYLPLATTRMHHKAQPFVMVHMAQSLDGKVCTDSGMSKWIGNQENLIHAHRIRALVDGVVVGGNTARQEKPSLNVRHVTGPDPARILLCNSSKALEDLPQIEGMRNILLCDESKISDLDPEVLRLSKLQPIAYCSSTNQIDLNTILANLMQEGIQSILLEGGPTTIKTFVQNGALNWLQLHIAPIVFGSGKSFVSLPEIASVSEAKKLTNIFYTQMGDAMVVTGQL